ncbi:MAG: anaerobic ribonucleoside-triphosphate reductase activating protein [Bacilli bacterium]|nr:anaerobic ribonucleoside-triphosphate reductase activating protein [Bacilli bacterium]
MKIRLARPLLPDSIVDGEGIRTVLWTQGCSHNCLGCHNPDTHSFEKGTFVDVEDVKKDISKLKCQDGITLSGGDPFFQTDAILEIAKYCKSINLNLWCYTGFTYEQIMAMSSCNPNALELLKYIDVLVDGKFVLAEKSLNLKFRGSKNQRIIDVKKSLKAGHPILIKKYISKKTYAPMLKEEKYIFV